MNKITCNDMIDRYRTWVLANPNLVGDAEAVLKWCSYLVAGYVKNSVLLSEFLFSASHLVTFLNDRILSKKLDTLQPKEYSWIEYVLSVVEAAEVFLELAGLKFGGPAGRWAVIVALQVLKTSLRLVLLLRDQKTMLLSPSIPGLDRSRLLSVKSSGAKKTHQEGFTFTLKKSGRVIRKIDGAPPAIQRDWKAPVSGPAGVSETHLNPLNRRRLVAEVVYVVRPLLHLMAMGQWGEKSWKPFLLSVCLDSYSQGSHETAAGLTEAEQQELVRRRFSLLNYLLRSPLYDQKSKAVIVWLLKFLRQNLPVGGSLAGALLHYLPHYQQVYFYTWSQ